MRRILPFSMADMDALVLHPAQARDCVGSPADAARMLAGHGSAFTLRGPDATVLLIAGIAAIDSGYGHCWAFMAADAGPHMPWLTRKVRAHLDDRMKQLRRVEMTVRADFAPARRWAVLLGFQCEGPMQCAAPDGGDMLRYARINPKGSAA